MGVTNIGSDEYRPAQPIGAPGVKAADAAWRVLDLAIEDVAPAYYSRKNFPADDKPDVELTVKQALVVAMDTAMVCARDARSFHVNTLFDALAWIWSERFRDAKPATTSWDMTVDTIREARREMLQCGVDLARIWRAIRDGVPELFTMSRIRGDGHARGYRARACRGAVKKWRGVIANDPEYRSPQPKMRLLLAREKTPRLKIARSVAGERAYDVMPIGDRTKRVIRLLERVRLFLRTDVVKRNRDDLRRQEEAHPWPKTSREWEATQPRPRDRKKYEAARKKFMREHHALQKEYLSLSGRADQIEAIWKQIRKRRRDIDEYGLLEIKTAYYKIQNRRFQPRHIWPTEVSSKEKLPFIDEDEHGRPLTFVFSQRGEWFGVRSFRKHEKGHTWIVALDGADVSASMAQILAIVLGWRETERMLSDHDFKDGLVEALDVVAGKVPDFTRPKGTPQQLRKGVGVLTNIPYGASFGSMAKDLRDNPATYGENWGSKKNLMLFIMDGARHDRRVKILDDMRTEYLETCRALVQAAAKDPYAGMTFTDPFDGVKVRWHAPGRLVREMGNHDLPLYVSEPVGEPRNGEYPVNYKGVERPAKRVKTKKDAKPRWDSRGSLLNSFAPCMIHTLDASFAGHVIEQLAALDVRDIVPINDCFLVPADARAELDEAMRRAGRPWFEGLGPFYEVFERYLGNDPVYRPIVRGWRKKWDQRKQDVAAGKDRWPEFRTKTETTFAVKIIQS